MTSDSPPLHRDTTGIYDIWSRYYDKIYLTVFGAAHRKIGRAAQNAGHTLLEVGVGTGLVLRHYPRQSTVIGIDICVPMLRKAQEKVTREALSHVRGLITMDACHLGFPDQSFDAVSVPFVISLIPEPEKALDEMARVLKPNGEIIIASKFGAQHAVMSKIDAFLDPLVRKIGWTTNFQMARITQWAENHGGFDRAQSQRGWLFTVVRLKKK